MKKFNLKKSIITTCFLISLIAWGCSSDDETNINNNPPAAIIEKNFTIGKGATLIYDLGAQPIEGGYTITINPKKSKVSHIISSLKNGVHYEYIPIENFTGKDFVEITSIISIGNSNFYTDAIHKITIEVTSD